MAESETRLVGNTDEDLREWIRTNMVSERSTLLRDLRERAAKILSLNDDGSIRQDQESSFPLVSLCSARTSADTTLLRPDSQPIRRLRTKNSARPFLFRREQ